MVTVNAMPLRQWPGVVQNTRYLPFCGRQQVAASRAGENKRQKERPLDETA